MACKKVKYEDLEVGMIVVGAGVITDVPPHNLYDTIHQDGRWIAFIDYNDPYWGHCSRTLADEETEFEVMVDRAQEKQILEDMRKAIEERIHDAYSDMEFLNKEIGWRAMSLPARHEVELDIDEMFDEFDDGNGDNIEGA